MNSVHLVSFATPDFFTFQDEMIASAASYSIFNNFKYTESDLINTSFYKDNIEIFKYKRGFGYWLWKPYFIIKSMEQIAENDILFYVDSGSKFINDPNVLINLVANNESGVVSFDCWPLTNHQWGKRDVFINMGCDTEEFWYEKHVIATVILFRKTPKVISFLNEWLLNCLNKYSLTEENNIVKHNLSGFVKHMGDQPIFSVLIKKHGIETYRNPSMWGNFLKSPEFRIPGEFVGYPYFVENSIHDYFCRPYSNSPYDTIFEFNRNPQSNVSSNNSKLYEKLFKKLFKKISAIISSSK